MNRDGHLRRRWTHRRLGLGAVDAGLADTERLLTAVGLRRTSTGEVSDGFEVALFDYVRRIDQVAGIADIEATPIPIAALRTPAAKRPLRRFGWGVLIPATSGALATIALAVTLVVAGSTSKAPTAAPTSSPTLSTEPTLSAVAQSRQLLDHADRLLTVAKAAAPARRTKLVAEVRADLSHVARLVPLAPPHARSRLRTQMKTLDRRVKPLAPPPPAPPPARPSDDAQSTAAGRPTTGSHSTAGGQSAVITQSAVATRPAANVPPVNTAPLANAAPTVSDAPTVSANGDGAGQATGVRRRPAPNPAGQRPPNGNLSGSDAVGGR